MRFTVTWSEPKRFAEGNFGVHDEGVYLIGYRDTATDARYVVYVGQGAIGTRLADHSRDNTCVTKKLGHPGRAGYYRYAIVPDEDDRLDIELGLYNKYNPASLCNDIAPPGSGQYTTIQVDESFR